MFFLLSSQVLLQFIFASSYVGTHYANCTAHSSQWIKLHISRELRVAALREWRKKLLMNFDLRRRFFFSNVCSTYHRVQDELRKFMQKSRFYRSAGEEANCFRHFIEFMLISQLFTSLVSVWREIMIIFTSVESRERVELSSIWSCRIMQHLS